MSEREIEFKDIRVGDTIRREWKELDVLKTHTGTAARIHRGDFFTEMGATLAFANWRGFTYILVDRPKPPLPTEPGSVIIATKVRGIEGKWKLLLHEEGHWASSGPIRAYNLHPRVYIEEWRPTEIFEVQP